MLCNAVEAKARVLQLTEKLHVSEIKTEQAKDPELNKIKLELQKTNPSNGYYLCEDIIYKIDPFNSDSELKRICIPKTLVGTVLKLGHDLNCHPGIAKTHLDCKSQLHWENMLKDIQSYVNNCGVCMRAKHSNNNQTINLHHKLPPHANHTIAIDLLGGLPKSGKYTQILIIVCAYSRFTKAIPLMSGTAEEIIKGLEGWREAYGDPFMVISDNAGAFVSHKFKDFLENPLVKMRQHLITPYAPQSNLAERLLRDVLSLLRVLTRDKPDTWPAHLPQVNTAINHGVHLTLKQRPSALFFGREPKASIIDFARDEGRAEIASSEPFIKTIYARELVEKELTKAHEYRDSLQTTGRLTSYDLNDIVYLKRNFVNDKGYKIKYQFIGPFKINEIIGNTVTLLNLANGKERRAHMRNLKIFKSCDLTKSDHPNVDRMFPRADPPELEAEVFKNEENQEPTKISPKKYNLRSKVQDKTK